MTGEELRLARLEYGWSQREMARRAGLTHKAVQYWEGRPEINFASAAVRAMARAMSAEDGEFCAQYARARGGVLQPSEAVDLAREVMPWMSERLARRVFMRRVRCGAKTRKGTPCRAKSEPGKKRCRFHGGASTGPRTAEGKARIAEAQRTRWAAWRADRNKLAFQV
jgi:transcriptional regulator with XRE-family HTH domain